MTDLDYKPTSPPCPRRPGRRSRATSPLGSSAPVVVELEGDPEILLAEHRDHRLQVVATLGGHADLVLLDRGLHLELRVLDHPDDLPGLLHRDPLLQRDLLPDRAACRRLDLAEAERLERSA